MFRCHFFQIRVKRVIFFGFSASLFPLRWKYTVVFFPPLLCSHTRAASEEGRNFSFGLRSLFPLHTLLNVWPPSFFFFPLRSSIQRSWETPPSLWGSLKSHPPFSPPPLHSPHHAGHPYSSATLTPPLLLTHSQVSTGFPPFFFFLIFSLTRRQGDPPVSPSPPPPSTLFFFPLFSSTGAIAASLPFTLTCFLPSPRGKRAVSPAFFFSSGSPQKLAAPPSAV